MHARAYLSVIALLGSAASAVGAAGCTNDLIGPMAGLGGGPPATGGSGGTGATPAAGAGTYGGAGAGPVASDLPCDVQSLLATSCVACHEEAPPGFLFSRADLTRPSATDSSRSVAEEALLRMQSSGRDHMPPKGIPQPSATQVEAFRAWVEGGAPVASCGSSTTVGPDPYDTPVVCTSGRRWTGGNEESPLMHPGVACIDCHESGGEAEGPRFIVAGTVYPTPHEPNDCNGVASSSGSAVVITDASGVEHRLTPNGAGNFFLEDQAFPFPYTAKVVYDGRERVMVQAQDDGDCNACHTEAGTNRAPGRIFVP